MPQNIEIKEPYLADLVERVCCNLLYKGDGRELTRCTLTLKNGEKVMGHSGRPPSLSSRWESEADLYKRACKLATEDAVKNLKTDYLTKLIKSVDFYYLWSITKGLVSIECVITAKNGRTITGVSKLATKHHDKVETEEEVRERTKDMARAVAMGKLEEAVLFMYPINWHLDETNETKLKGTNHMTQYFLSEDQMRDEIADVRYMNVEDTTLTICVIILKNGYTVTGESSCIDPSKFNAEIGKKIAYDNAFNKLWGILGYVKKQQWFTETQVKQA